MLAEAFMLSQPVSGFANLLLGTHCFFGTTGGVEYGFAVEIAFDVAEEVLTPAWSFLP